jgi:hypothetical protein
MPNTIDIGHFERCQVHYDPGCYVVPVYINGARTYEVHGTMGPGWPGSIKRRVHHLDHVGMVDNISDSTEITAKIKRLSSSEE